MKRLSLILALTVLGGCTTFDSTTEPVAAIEQGQVHSSLAQLNYQSINVYEKAIRIEQVLNQKSQWSDVGGVASPVASWKLPDYGVYRFKLESFVSRSHFGTRASTFIPELWLLDAEYLPLQKLSAERFSYDEQAMLSREALSQEFIIDNRDENRPSSAYLVALATEASVEKVIQVANFDEQYAKARARTAYPSGDVFAEAVVEGAIRLTVTPLVSPKNVSAHTPEVYAPDYVPSPAVQALQHSSNTDLKQLSGAHIADIKTALTEGDIQQAMQMRDSARELNARLHRYFTESYGKNKPAELSVSRKEVTGSPYENLHSAFLLELELELQKGNAQNALAILDLSSQLVRHIDAVF